MRILISEKHIGADYEPYKELACAIVQSACEDYMNYKTGNKRVSKWDMNQQ